MISPDHPLNLTWASTRRRMRSTVIEQTALLEDIVTRTVPVRPLFSRSTRHRVSRSSSSGRLHPSAHQCGHSGHGTHLWRQPFGAVQQARLPTGCPRGCHKQRGAEEASAAVIRLAVVGEGGHVRHRHRLWTRETAARKDRKML